MLLLLTKLFVRVNSIVVNNYHHSGALNVVEDEDDGGGDADDEDDGGGHAHDDCHSDWPLMSWSHSLAHQLVSELHCATERNSS